MVARILAATLATQLVQRLVKMQLVQRLVKMLAQMMAQMITGPSIVLWRHGREQARRRMRDGTSYRVTRTRTVLICFGRRVIPPPNRAARTCRLLIYPIHGLPI